jgi:hypothetical protein
MRDTADPSIRSPALSSFLDASASSRTFSYSSLVPEESLSVSLLVALGSSICGESGQGLALQSSRDWLKWRIPANLGISWVLSKVD